MKETIVEINKTKGWFFEKVNKISRLNKEKKKKREREESNQQN